MFTLFQRANIYWTLRESCDEQYIYVILTVSSDKSENWADDNNIDVALDAKRAIQKGREDDNFHLAHNTMIDEDESEYVEWSGHGQFKKLPFESWASIHIPFERVIGDVYQRHPTASGEQKIICNRLHLRIIYDILTSDEEVGGAGFLVDKYIVDGTNPLQSFFALNNDFFNPAISKKEYMISVSCYGVWNERVENLRDYYGENVAFYFAFLVHYSKWLMSLAVMGTLWFAAQMYTGEMMIQFDDNYLHNKFIAALITGLVCLGILWATLMLETWYRKEHQLQFEWGMMRYSETETPLFSFQGEFKINPATGEFAETYASVCAYRCKRIFSMSTITFCIAVVVSCVFGIWIWKRQIEKGDPSEFNTYVGIAAGVVNSLQIQIFNAIFTRLAAKLNDFEGHRLQQEWYDSLVVKRITFIIINSFNSLFYIAFYDDRYSAGTAKLLALRVQLLTLFLTAIIVQNSMELLCPCIFAKIKEKLEDRKRAELEKHSGDYPENMDSPLIVSANEHHNHNAIGLAVAGSSARDHHHHHGVPSQDDESESMVAASKPEEEVFDDIEQQMELQPCPDILDNTAEIVVLHGYIILFMAVLPLMPLLGVLNNVFELRIDYYNFTNCQRPYPAAANGIGVWKVVMSVFNVVAIFSNVGLVVFETELIPRAIPGTENDRQTQLIVFFTTTLVLLFVQFGLKFLIDDYSEDLQNAINRQKICEKHLLLNKIKSVARKMAQEKKRYISLTNVYSQREMQPQEEEES